MSKMALRPIAVVGAGWAGLACAFTLVHQGLPVLLLEAAPQAGGRARGVLWGTHRIDNGQHVLLGAYTHILGLLKDLGIPETQVFDRKPFELLMIDYQKRNRSLHVRKATGSIWGALLSLFTTRGLAFSDKLRLLAFLKRLRALDPIRVRNESTLDFLIKAKQSKRLIKCLWEPLNLAALSTPLDQSSAEIFVSVLRKTFVAKQDASDWLFPKVDLSDLLPRHILDYLAHKHTPVLYHQRVRTLQRAENGDLRIHTTSQHWDCQAIVLATPPSISLELLKTLANPKLDPLIEALGRFQYQSIATLYLRFAKPIDWVFGSTMIGLIHATSDWILHRTASAQTDLLSIVITNPKALALDRSALLAAIQAEIKVLFPKLGDPIDQRLIFQKEAAFRCTPEGYHYRPFHHTVIPNLYLAGDYTQNTAPATLESAVQSGIQTAKLLLLEYEIRHTRLYSLPVDTATLEDCVGLFGD